MIVYLIKSSLCMFVLWGFYLLFLEKEKMHHVKRFYLILSLIFALVIPTVTFTYTTTKIPVEPQIEHQEQIIMTTMSNEDVSTPSVNYTLFLLYSVYGVGFLIFGFRFLRNLKNLTLKITTNERLKESSHVNVLVGNTAVVPHTFLKYIFVSKKAYQEQSIPKEVLLHEQTHVTQKHTLDILFVEILQVVLWFNPLLFWIKKAIKLNHEFLADQTVLKRQFSLHQYMNLLVNYPNSTNQAELSSPINYSLTKKRIIMMSQQFSKTRAAAKMLLLLPMLLGCMLLFNNEIIAQQKNVNYTKTVEDTDPNKKIKIKINGDQIKVNGKTTEVSNFAKTIDEITKQWNDDELTGFNFNVQINNADNGLVQKLNETYRKTRLYKADSNAHDLIPPPPPLPKAPRVRKGEASTIPAPPAPPKLKKSKKRTYPKPLKPLKPSKAPAVGASYEEINEEIEEDEVITEMDEVEEAMHEAEMEHEHEIENVMHMVEEARAHAIEVAERARESAEEVRREAMEVAREARIIAREEANLAMEESHKIRERAMHNAEIARLKAEEMAMLHSVQAEQRANIAMLQAERAREKARNSAHKARKEAGKARRKALDEARKAQVEVRREVEKARKEARKIMEEARKEERRAFEKSRKENN